MEKIFNAKKIIYAICLKIKVFCQLTKIDTLMGLIFARTNFRELENFAFREDLFSRMSCFTIFREYLFSRIGYAENFREY